MPSVTLTEVNGSSGGNVGGTDGTNPIAATVPKLTSGETLTQADGVVLVDDPVSNTSGFVKRGDIVGASYVKQDTKFAHKGQFRVFVKTATQGLWMASIAGTNTTDWSTDQTFKMSLYKVTDEDTFDIGSSLYSATMSGMGNASGGLGNYTNTIQMIEIADDLLLITVPLRVAGGSYYNIRYATIDVADSTPYVVWNQLVYNNLSATTASEAMIFKIDDNYWGTMYHNNSTGYMRMAAQSIIGTSPSRYSSGSNPSLGSVDVAENITWAGMSTETRAFTLSDDNIFIPGYMKFNSQTTSGALDGMVVDFNGTTFTEITTLDLPGVSLTGYVNCVQVATDIFYIVYTSSNTEKVFKCVYDPSPKTFTITTTTLDETTAPFVYLSNPLYDTTRIIKLWYNSTDKAIVCLFNNGAHIMPVDVSNNISASTIRNYDMNWLKYNYYNGQNTVTTDNPIWDNSTMHGMGTYVDKTTNSLFYTYGITSASATYSSTYPYAPTLFMKLDMSRVLFRSLYGGVISDTTTDIDIYTDNEMKYIGTGLTEVGRAHSLQYFGVNDDQIARAAESGHTKFNELSEAGGVWQSTATSNESGEIQSIISDIKTNGLVDPLVATLSEITDVTYEVLPDGVNSPTSGNSYYSGYVLCDGWPAAMYSRVTCNTGSAYKHQPIKLSCNDKVEFYFSSQYYQNINIRYWSTENNK